MPHVTDHAVLRWLERVAGVNVEAIRAHLTVHGIGTAASIGCDTIIMGDGTRLRLRGDTVVTVLGARKHRKQQRTKQR